MNRLTAVGLVSLVAYGVLLVAKWEGSPSPAKAGTASVVASAPAAGVADRRAVAVSSNAAWHPTAPAPRRTASGSPPPKLSEVAQQFRQTRDLKAFADALLARKDSLDAEERYYLAKALETCAFANSVNDDLVATSDKRRRQFIATISPGDPDAAKRIAAYDASDDTQRCLGFANTRIAQKQIDDLYRESSQGGDPRAQARMLVADLNRSLAAPKIQGEARAVAGDDFQRIIGLLETRDAEAMVMVAQFLAQHRLIGELRIGPNAEVPEPASLVGAFSLVACDLQPACPALDREALQACAYAGYCNAGSYEELFANFLASPWSYSMAMRYREVIHTAIDTHNWSLLGLQKLIGAKSGAGS
jgi:hypothetical protein